MPAIMIFLRPILSDRAPKNVNNGMPSRIPTAITIRDASVSSLRIVEM